MPGARSRVCVQAARGADRGVRGRHCRYDRKGTVIIARVVGNVVATQKEASHEGKKILLIQPLDLENQPIGDALVALDAVDAGVGDRVLAVQEGFSAMTSVGHTESPIDAAVIGVVDLVEFAWLHIYAESWRKRSLPASSSM